MSGTLHYPDVYSGDAGINFSNSYVVVAKATENTTYTNPAYEEFVQQAAQNDVYLVAYHFLHAGNAKAQAQHFASVIGKGVHGMVDVEPTQGSNPSIADAAEFVNECWALGVQCNFVYLPKWYWSETLKGASLESVKGSPARRLVTSDYTSYSDTGVGWGGYGGLEVAAWQYSDSVNYGGMPQVDFNAFKGSGSGNVAQTLQEFKDFAGKGEWPA